MARPSLVLLSLLAARPLWKDFDPIDVLLAWENEAILAAQEVGKDQ